MKFIGFDENFFCEFFIIRGDVAEWLFGRDRLQKKKNINHDFGECKCDGTEATLKRFFELELLFLVGSDEFYSF